MLRLLVLLFAGIVASPLLLKAQANPVFFEPTFSYSFGTPLDIDRQAVNSLGSNGLGTSYAHNYGAGLELSLPRLIASSVGLSLVGEYVLSNGAFSSNTFTSSDNSVSLAGVQQFHLTSNYQTASLALFGTYQFGGAMETGIGAQFSYRTTDALTEWREIFSPAGATFSNGSTTDSIATTAAISSAPFRIAIPAFIGYHFPLSDALSLESRLIGTVDLNEVFAGYASESVGIGLSIALCFSHAAHAESNAEQKPVAPSPPVKAKPIAPAPAKIDAAVHLDINGVAAHHAWVREVDTLIERFAATVLDVRIPDATSRLVRSYIVPDLSVSRYMASQAGIKTWRIRITQNGRTVSEYSNVDSNERETMDAAIDLGTNGTKLAPLVANLQVTDRRGGTRSVADTLELTLDTVHTPERIERKEYYFLDPSNTNVKVQDSLLLRNLVSSLDTNATLMISPTASPCPGYDSLARTVLLSVQASRTRLARIELLAHPQGDSKREPCALRVVLWQREE